MITAATPGIAERIDAITRFLPALERPGAAGVWAGGEKGTDGTITMPWFNYSEEALAFIQACYDNDWVDATFD